MHKFVVTEKGVSVPGYVNDPTFRVIKLAVY
jgi:hypothetical protein